MKRMTQLFGACLIVVAGGAVRADDQKQDKPFSDEIFVKEAASGGMTEVELGKIGQMKATGDDPIRLLDELLETHELFVNFRIVMRDDQREVIRNRLDGAERLPEFVRDQTENVGGRGNG